MAPLRGRKTSPLLSARRTWIAITGFWVLFGLTSWWIEYALSFRSPDGPMTIGRAAARLVYAVLWWGLSLCGIWICDAVPVRDFRQVLRLVFHILLGGVVSVLWAVLAYYINLAIIPGWLPLGVGPMISTTFIGSYFYYRPWPCSRTACSTSGNPTRARSTHFRKSDSASRRSFKR